MNLNRNNMQKIMLLILFAVLLFLGLQQFQYVLAGMRALLHLIRPFIIGSAIAFIFNVPMHFLEKNLFPRYLGSRPHPLYRMRRVLSLILTFVLLAAVLAIVAVMVIPEIVRSLATVGERFTAFSWRLTAYFDTLLRDYPDLIAEVQKILAQWDTIDWKAAGQAALDFFARGNVIGNTVSAASAIIGGLTHFIIGLVFSIYLLLQKERLASQLKRTLYAFLPETRVDRFLDLCRLSSQTFSSFISGQCLEACILGLMFFISMVFLRMPYALIIAILIAITALIPIFGTLIACAVGTFLILIVSPIQAFWFLILFLALQQIEGNLIYPHVVGNSVGLPSIWVLVAVTLGASTMGVTGMVISIPLVSIFYTLLRQTVRDRLRVRQINRSKLR